MNKDLGIKIAFILVGLFSVYLLISGISSSETTNTSNSSNEILEEQLTVNPTSLSMIVGDTSTITATILPVDTTNKNLYWETANSNIATVDEGKVTAINPGKTVIKVTTEKRKITRIINVTVSNKEIPITEIITELHHIDLEVGDTKKIEYEIYPSDATNKKVSFITGDKNIAAFNKEGLLVGVSEGETTITLKSSNDVTATVNIKVKNKDIPVSKVTLNKKKLTLEIGKTETLTHKVIPTNATNTNVTWTSSNNSVATVSNGKVTAKKAGTSTITVKTDDGEKTATCKVTVNNPKPPTQKPIVPSSYIDKYESNTLKYYLVKTEGYYLTYIWMEDPYNQIRKLEAHTAAYGKVLKDSEITGNYQHLRMNVGDMMQNYINYGIIPVNKGAVGYNGSGFYASGSWDPPAKYYDYHSNSWLSLMDGIVLRYYPNDGLTQSDIIGIAENGDLKVYEMTSDSSKREAIYNEIKKDKVKNTWSFLPYLVKDGKVYDDSMINSHMRQAICQVNTNNYIMLTTIYSYNYNQMSNLFVSLGCKTAHNLDGGGSTSMYMKKAGERTPTKVKCSENSGNRCRAIIEGIYFVEK